MEILKSEQPNGEIKEEEIALRARGIRTHTSKGHAWKKNKRKGSRGREDDRRMLVYVGGLQEIEIALRLAPENGIRRIIPPGHGPDYKFS